MPEFTELLSELEALQKAMPCADDADGPKKVKKAAMEGGAADAGADVPNAGEGDEDADTMGKSFRVKLEDGSEVEAVDGSAMLKALDGDLKALRGEAADMAKSFGTVVALLKSHQATIVAQADLIKSLTSDVTKLANSGSGRKAVLSVLEKAAPAGDTAAKTPTRGEILAKAAELNVAGRLTAVDVALIEGNLNRGNTAAAASLIAQASL